MSLNSGANQDVVKTTLDAVVFQEFEAEPGPQIASATDTLCFQQGNATNAAKILESYKGVGLWGTRAEQADVPSSTPSVGDKKTFSVLNYANSVDITKNFFDDEMFDVVGNMMREFGDKARITQDDNAMGIFRNSFTTELTADGVALFSNSHVNLNGDTVDNLETAALTESQLNVMLVKMMEQVDQAGVVRGHMAQTLLVPPALFKTAVEITDSVLRSGTDFNDINIYSAKYNLIVKQSPYLGAAAGGSDTAYFLLAKNHQIHRFVRQELVTSLINWDLQRNNNYIYKGEFRETLGALTYEGAVGSNGTT